jgi:hypothetical protein
MFYPQTNFYPQAGFPQTGFAPQQTPFFTQSPFSNWQQSVQQPIRQSFGQSFGIQPPGMNAFNGIANGAAQPGLAPWAQPQAQAGLTPWVQPQAQAGLGPWAQPQAGLEQTNPTLQHLQQFNPSLQQVSYGHLLQQLAQYHNVIAQQLAHLAAQTALVSAGTYPFAGQFIPNQLSANFGSGITMH